VAVIEKPWPPGTVSQTASVRVTLQPLVQPAGLTAAMINWYVLARVPGGTFTVMVDPYPTVKGVREADAPVGSPVAPKPTVALNEPTGS
jgi:hypothetical protein